MPTRRPSFRTTSSLGAALLLATAIASARASWGSAARASSTSAAQAPAPRADPSPAPAPLSIAPFWIDGTRVGEDEQALWILYGPCRQKLEELKLARVVERELARRADLAAARKLADREATKPFAAGSDGEKARAAERQRLAASELELLRKNTLDVQGEVDLAVHDALEQFGARYPDLDARAEMRRSFRGEAWFRSQLTWARVFDRLFLPPDEALRPDLTVAAMKARFGDRYDSWQKAWRLADGSVDPQYQNMVRQVVRDHLFASERFTSSLAGPDHAIAVRADEDGDGKTDWTLSTADAWKTVADAVFPDEIESARRYWTTYVATRAGLEREKLLLSQSEGDAAIADIVANLQEFVPTFEAFAVQQHRFPSAETFREFYLLSRAYQKKLEPVLADAAAGPGESGGGLQPAIQAHLPRVDARFGGVAIDAEVLLVSGYDFVHASWKPGGLEAARAHAEELAKKLRDNESAWKAHAAGAEDPDALWTRLVDAESAWWDPPMPKDAPADGPTSLEHRKGRFGPRESAELMELLELTRYDLWTGRAELLDALWVDLAPGVPAQASTTSPPATTGTAASPRLGAVGGPYAHRYGACLARVRSRTAPKRPLDATAASQRELIKLDYLDESFRRYARDAVKTASIRATPPSAEPSPR